MEENYFVLFSITLKNIEKIEEILNKYKELKFNYNYDKIINDLISGVRPYIKVENVDHKDEIVALNFYESNDIRIIVDLKCLGYYMIYKKADLIFKPCKLYDEYIIKKEWNIEQC